MNQAVIRPADPHEPGAVALLEASQALMQSLFPADVCHYLSIEALRGPDIRFFLAEEGGAARGCVALAVREGYGEVKSMFVAPDSRGTGLAARLLDRVEAEARATGLPLMRLETGTTLNAALRLYERGGYAFRGPFGGYCGSPWSLFMEKAL